MVNCPWSGGAMVHNVIIIGSGPAGLTAAIYAARAERRPILIEGLQPGGQLTITTHVENYPGFAEPIAGHKLMEDMRAQAQKLGVTLIQGTVTGVDFLRRPLVVQVGGERMETHTLIIATGAEAKWLGIDSETKLRGKGVSACATCDGFFFKGKTVAVIGGGDTAMEEALFLTHFATKVIVIHRRDKLRASKIMQDRALANPKIEFLWNAAPDEFLDAGKGVVTGLRIKDVKTGVLKEIACDGIFVAIGHKPNTDFFKGKIKMDAEGYIITTKCNTFTSVSGVFAAGDCQDRDYRQAITAAGSGCMAAMDSERFLQEMESKRKT